MVTPHTKLHMLSGNKVHQPLFTARHFLVNKQTQTAPTHGLIVQELCCQTTGRPIDTIDHIYFDSLVHLI